MYEENPHPLDDFTMERVERQEARKLTLMDFPPLKEYWSEDYWWQVQGKGCSRTRPARMLTYGPDPSVFLSRGRSLYFLWKRGGRGEGREI